MDIPAQVSVGRPAVAAPVVKTQHQKVRTRRNHHRKVSSFILVACIVLAVMTVLVVPLLVGGAAAPSSVPAEAAPAQAEVRAVSTMGEAGQALGFEAAAPAALPDGFELSAIRVVDGSVLELEYAGGKTPVVYRTASGSDDLTWTDAEYAFTVTEEVDGVTRSYAGVAEQKLSVALWAEGGYSYALVASEGMDAEALRLMAESVG